MTNYNFLSAKRITALLATTVALGFATPGLVQAEETNPENINHESNGTFIEGSTNQVASPEEISDYQEEDGTITVAHTNDMHGRINENIGIADAAQFYESIDADIVVDAGDAFQGLPISNHDDGKTMNDAMVESSYDAIAVGNHEFDFGQDVASSYGGPNTPLLSANTVKEDGEQMFQPSHSVTTDSGHHIGIVGVTTPETKTKTHPDNVSDVVFQEPIKAVTDELNRLIADTTIAEDAFIVLAHLGLDQSTPEAWRGDTLARALDDNAAYDAYQILVIDGHSHTAAPAQSFNNVLYQQTGTELNNIGVITFDPSQPGSAKGRLYNQDEVNDIIGDATNETVANIVAQAEEIYAEETSQVIVENNPVWLNGVREFVRTQETNMGNLITDAMMVYSRDGFSNPTDFAMINGGGIRDQIAKDQPMTIGDVIAVLPFGNIIAQIEVTGQDIYEMFEFAYQGETLNQDLTNTNGEYTVPAIDPETGLPNLSAVGGFLQVSDEVRIYFDPTRPGLAEEDYNTDQPRVLEVQIKDDAGNYQPVDRDGTYYMATNDFLAQGGDGYTMLGGRREEGPSLDQVVIDVIAGELLDLNDYADPTPSTRIIATTAEDFASGQDDQDDQVDDQDDQDNQVDVQDGQNNQVDDQDDPNLPEESQDPDTDGQVKTGPDQNRSESSQPASQEKAEKDSASSESSEEESLPETGTASVVGLAASSILLGLGLAGGRKKN